MSVIDCLINGQPGTALSVYDRGLQFGDGVFETMLVSHGQLPLWARHLQRLHDGCSRLGIPAPDPAPLYQEAMQLSTGLAQGIIKIVVTRGESRRGYAATGGTSTRIVQRFNWTACDARCWQHGVSVKQCTLRLARQPLLAGIKHLNRLEHVLARAEWSGDEYDEGLLFDTEQYLVEAIARNVFIVQAGELYTPDLTHSGVAGIMRQIVLEYATELGIKWHVTTVTQEQLTGADAVFLCNSLHGIWPVRRIESRSYPVDRITRRLQQMTQRIFPWP